MKRVRLTLWILLLLFALPASLIVAQDEAEATEEADDAALSYRSPVSGMIDDSNSREIWPLEVTALDRISIRAERTSGNLLPDLIVRDPNGDDVAESFGTDDTGAAAVIDNLAFERTGTYQILVQRENFEDGLTSGEYSLTVDLLAAGEDSLSNAQPIGPIEYNTFIEGRITPDHWLHRYTLDAPAADTIRVSAARNAGTLMPEVEVRDSDDNSLRIGYNEGTGDFATLSFDLPQAGQYTVIVTRDRRFTGETLGTYRLTLDLLGAGEGSPVLDQVMGEVEYGTPLVGELVDGQWYQDWILNAQAGDVITIVQQRPLDAASGTGNLRPEVALLGGSEQELRRGYVDNTGATATIERYKLDAPGQYIVRASRERQQDGPTSGSYVLTVTLNGSGPGSPNLSGSTGTVETGATVEGEVTDAQWMNSWEFSAQADQQIDLRVERTSGTLIPQIDIQDVNGQSLRTVYADRTQDSAEVTSYRFPSNGTFRIVVLRDRAENGYTSGGYQLSVSATPSD